jgi:hypothetical protein
VDAFYRLVKIDGELHTPPIVRLTWGNHFPGMVNDGGEGPTPAFDCIVTSCSRRFTLFNPDGKPLRAVVTLALREYKNITEQLQALNLQSADHTRTHVVQEGENLTLIAFEAYQDAAYWRVIADGNNIHDVRNLTPGTVLALPPIK